MAQMTRIFKAYEPDCTIVYVSPIKIPYHVLKYYEKVFSFGGMTDKFFNKIHFISV